MNTYTKYTTYIKPDWAPPAWLFEPVWTILYAVIAVSFGYIIYKWWKGEISWKMVLPFKLNLLFNLLFTPIQFGLQNNTLAAVDILLILGTLLWSMTIIWKKYTWVALVNVPYLAWVSFATVLQLTITYLNW